MSINIIDNEDEYLNNRYHRCGIINEGNTCYMNSIIQSIYNIPIIVKNVFEINLKNNTNKNIDLIKQLQIIFSKLNLCDYNISIKNIFQKLKFQGHWNSNQDAHEYYTKIMEIITDFNSTIKKLTNGILVNKIEVPKKKYFSIKEEEFLFLELEIEKSHTLKDSFKLFFSKETLKGENKIEIMEKGKKEYYEGTKKSYIKQIPEILHICLKRFKYNETNNSFFKINNKITFEEKIDLSEYMYCKDSNQKYILYCALIHSGTMFNGHYFIIIKALNKSKFSIEAMTFVINLY